MKLIEGLRIPPFARLVWVSLLAQELWEEKTRLAASAYHQLELLSVKHGLRKCLTRHFRPDSLAAGVADLARQGLVFLPLRQVGSYSGFAHSHPPVVSGQPWTFYGVISRSIEDALRFQQATEEGDHLVMGELLGYPECCTHFFDRVWRQQGFVDPIWQAAENAVQEGGARRVDDHTIEVSSYSPLVLSVLRYSGFRLTAQIPCSPGCEHAHRIAESWLRLGRELSVPGVEELIGLLSMPIQWDCLSGVAEIRTPLFKIVTNSMATSERYRVNYLGCGLPDGSASGLGFPYNNRNTRKGVQKSLRRFEEAINGKK